MPGIRDRGWLWTGISETQPTPNRFPATAGKTEQITSCSVVLFLARAKNADMREELLKASYLLLFYQKNNRILGGEENEGEH